MSAARKNKVKRISESEYEAYVNALKNLPAQKKADGEDEINSPQ